jgi:predicted glycogen debranching enzyme
MIGFGADICGDFDRAASKEWLETDGLGGYASSTIVGANTRRYHGLFVPAQRPPSGRTVLLSKLEETVTRYDLGHDLSCNQYPGAIHPQGYRYLSAFRLEPFPTFTYEIGSRGATLRLEKQVILCRGLQASLTRYRVLSSPGPVGLTVRPLLACRDYHSLMRANASLDTRATVSEAQDQIAMTLYAGCPTLYLHCPGAHFEPSSAWYHSFIYREEQARGLDCEEDLYSPGVFTRTLADGDTCYLVAAMEPPSAYDLPQLVEAEHDRRAQVRRGWEHAPEDVGTLIAATDRFLVSREPARAETPDSVIAGYHWFEEWGRDTMLSLPGLTLMTRRFDSAKTVLRTYAGLTSEGMLPNRIPDVGATPDYNTVDATLWMFWAAHKYLDYSGDRAFVADELLPALLDIIGWHVRGTRYGIRADGDGLLRAGEPGVQLTWMDAKIGDWVVTPRQGKAVEINALWHHALRFVEELGAEHAGPSAEAVAAEFARRFWNPQVGYLNDVVDGDVREDSSLRPNQIIAVSLPYPLLELDQARQVVAAVQRDLLTPYGLRSLSPYDPQYRPRYEGGPVQRDSAYHQGTVWPWLLGPFITAFLRVSEDKVAAQETARGWVAPLFGHLREAGLGQISEIFDADPPHRPCGCIAQAWSVAEVLRAVVEDLGGVAAREEAGVSMARP